MQGFVPVEIPTKKYVKAYIISTLGEKPIMNTENVMGQKLYDVLQHSTDERSDQFACNHYSDKLQIYIPIRTFKKRGAFLNKTNIKNFNLFIEVLLKDRFHLMMDDFIAILPSFENNLPEVRKRLGIDIEAWSDDSMKKDYYRYRTRSGKPLLYTKRFSLSVPSHFF